MKMPLQINRRTALRTAAGLYGAALLRDRLHAMPVAALPPRASGELDIHHIDTGRGNCTLIVGPDGTSIMVDAGAATVAAETAGPARPDSQHRPGEYAARYASGFVASGKLDYFVATHIHPDHIGDVSGSGASEPGKLFQTTGISDVDALLPITTVIDRAYPDYGDAPPLNAAFATNYLAFLQDRSRNGRKVEAARIGATDQITLQHSAASRWTDFQVRVLSANGKVWQSPARPVTAPENLESIALRLDFGAFSYYTGGDLTCASQDGTHPEQDLETPVAKACGPVEVAACNHHGYFDAVGPEFVRALQAQAYILQTWDVGHPGPAQIERLTSTWNGRHADVFATGLTSGNRIFNRRFIPLLKSTQGHVVVRVAAGGHSYTIYTTDSSRESGAVLASFGPYRSRS